MAGGADGEREAPPPSLGRAIRRALPAYLDEIVLFLLVNLVWLLVAVLFATAWTLIPLLALVLLPLLALPMAVLMRLAVATARDRSAGWPMVLAELPRHAGRKLLVAAVQLLVLALGAANVTLAPQIGGLLGIVSALVAGYAVVISSVYALALWPIVCDPSRDLRLPDQLRLALAVLTIRPWQMGVLAIIVVLAVIVSAQLIVPAAFLPGLVLIVVAGYVVPVADRLRPAADA